MTKLFNGKTPKEGFFMCEGAKGQTAHSRSEILIFECARGDAKKYSADYVFFSNSEIKNLLG